MNQDSNSATSGLRDLATAKAWAADDASTETLLARLYQQWPAVHPELASNPRTPVYLLARLANSDDPAIVGAIRNNPTAIASSVRPRTPWAAPKSAQPEPAPLGADTRYCPNPACLATVKAEQVRCFSCGAALRADVTGVISTTAAPDDSWPKDDPGATTPGWTAGAAATAPLYGVNAVRNVTPFGAVPAIASRAAQPDAARPLASATPPPDVIPPIDGEYQPGTGRGAFGVRAIDSRRARIGPIGLFGLFGLLGIAALAALIVPFWPRNSPDTRASSGQQVVPRKPTGDIQPRIPSTAVAGSAPAQGATTSVIPIVVADAPSILNTTPPPAPPVPTPETTAEPEPPATAPPTTKSTKPVAATTVDAPVSTLGPKSAPPLPSAMPSQLASLAQEYASALATKNADLVQALNPSQSGDLSGYKNLGESTVFPVSITSGSDPHTMKLGLVAHENTSASRRTVLFCATWKLNLSEHTVTPVSGRQLRSINSIVDPSILVSEIQKNCG